MSSKILNTVAIIDSGIGGLCILKSLIAKFNAGNYIYFADNLFMPYGSKSKQEITNRAKDIISTIKTNYKPDLIIIACNTMSCVIKDLQLNDVLCLRFNTNQTYIATPLTKSMMTNYRIIETKDLAKQIEKHIFNKKEMNNIVKQYIAKHKLDLLSELVLGCTHYELIVDYFKINCPQTKIICNSEGLINNLNVDVKDLNIVFILSKQSKNYEDKLRLILRSE